MICGNGSRSLCFYDTAPDMLPEPVKIFDTPTGNNPAS